MLWAVLTGLLVIFSLRVPDALLGVQASTSMTAVEHTFTVLSVAASPVAALVWAIALHSLLRWRRKGNWSPGDTDDGPPIRGSRAAVTSWIGGSAFLCLFILIWGLAALQVASSASPARVAPAQARNPLVVDVNGEQWVWTFTYPKSSDNPSVGTVESDQLYLPVDRAVVFKVTSDDVIHSFWVVEMGVKVDANPGIVTSAQTIPTKVGVYNVRCAELCGLLHADMETTAHVVTPTQFNAWLTSQAASR
jgi:cytochrome c oxidase subunit 2